MRIENWRPAAFSILNSPFSIRLRPAIRESAVFLLFAALAVAATWPLAIRLPTAVPDLGDPLLNAWIIDWVGWALIHNPLGVFQAPIFHPAEMPLAFSENLIGIAIFAIPFQLAGLAPLTVYNILLLLGFTHAGYGAFVLARVVTRATLPSIIGGIFFAFVSYKFDQLSHVQVLWSGWLPLLLAAVIAYWRRPSIGRAALVFGAFVINGLTNIHFLLFGGVALLLTIAVLAVLDSKRDARFWIQLASALALAGLVLLPVLLPYRHVAELYGMRRSRDEVRSGSATPANWLQTTTRSRVYGPYQPPDIRNELTLFPGLLPLFLMAAAAVMTRGARVSSPALRAVPPGARVERRAPLILLDGLIVGAAAVTVLHRTNLSILVTIILLAVRLLIRFPRALGGDRGRSLRTAAADSRFGPDAWASAGWIVLGFLGSLGLNAFLYTILYRHVAAFSALRVPARWAVIAYVGLAVWTALGAKALIERRRVMAAVLPLLMLVEVTPALRWMHAPVGVPPFYRWLADAGVGPVLELPPDAEPTVLYMLHSTTHRVPLMNGASGFEPPVHRAIREAYEQQRLDAAFTTLLEKSGARLIVLHGDALSHRTASAAAWIEEGIESGRIRFLRRFDSGVWGDWVFALTRNLPDWTTYRDFGPEERLRSFLDGKATYNASTFGRMELPRPHDSQTRRLDVSGWALSPHGIRSAAVLIDNGRLRIPMQHFQRPDVLAQFPWYPKVPEPGLHATLPRRPKGTPRHTDVQIEIVDGAGHVTRLPNTPFTWH